jgi:MerR family transcriptional regulator, light-induced transcriptional regulator
MRELADQAAPHSQYSIKAVATLTGLPASTIRTWERRHQVVSPRRTDGGDRRYGQDDLDKLILVRELVQAGESVRDVAPLSTDELRERAQRHGRVVAPLERAMSRAPKLAVLHPSLGTLIDATAGIELVYHASNIAAFEEHASATVHADLLFVDLNLVTEPSATHLYQMARRVGATAVIATYHFAPAAVLDALTRRGISLLQGPVNVDTLRRELQTRFAASPPTQGPVPTEGALERPRLFTDHELATIQELRPSIHCECPVHLASLAAQLVAFERYAARCQSKNPEDEAVHEHIAAGTARARGLIEVLLQDVLRHEENSTPEPR